VADEKEKQEQKGEELQIPDILPLLPIRDIVIFPFMIVPLFVGREKSIYAVDSALAKERLVFLTTQKDISNEEPEPKDLYQTGTVGMVMRMLKLPDGRVKVLIQGLARGIIKEYTQEKPGYIVNIEKVKETPVLQPTPEVEALMRNVREQLEKLASLGKTISPEIMMIIETVNEPGRLADIVAANLGLKVEDAQIILEIIEPIKRLERVNEYLVKELHVATIQVKIQSQAKEEMDKSQREYYLREQMRAIKSELGELEEITEEIDEIRKKIKKAKMPPDVEKETLKQTDRLESMHPDAAESAIIRTYLDWLVELPWSKSTKDTLEIKKAKNVLDEDHYDLEKIKERIL